MRKVTVEADRYTSRMRVAGAFADGFPQATLSAVLFTGSHRELVTAGVDVRVDGPDAAYRVIDTANGTRFVQLVELDLVVADTKSGLAMTQTGLEVREGHEVAAAAESQVSSVSLSALRRTCAQESAPRSSTGASSAGSQPRRVGPSNARSCRVEDVRSVHCQRVKVVMDAPQRTSRPPGIATRTTPPRSSMLTSWYIGPGGPPVGRATHVESVWMPNAVTSPGSMGSLVGTGKKVPSVATRG